MARIDRDSDTWRAVKEWAEGRLSMHTTNLKSSGMPIDETEYIRGSIFELEELLKQAKPAGPGGSE